jgi:hypothetical protein
MQNRATSTGSGSAISASSVADPAICSADAVVSCAKADTCSADADERSATSATSATSTSLGESIGRLRLRRV